MLNFCFTFIFILLFVIFGEEYMQFAIAPPLNYPQILTQKYNNFQIKIGDKKVSFNTTPFYNYFLKPFTVPNIVVRIVIPNTTKQA